MSTTSLRLVLCFAALALCAVAAPEGGLAHPPDAPFDQDSFSPPIQQGELKVKLETVASGLAAPVKALAAPGLRNYLFVCCSEQPAGVTVPGPRLLAAKGSRSRPQQARGGPAPGRSIWTKASAGSAAVSGGSRGSGLGGTSARSVTEGVEVRRRMTAEVHLGQDPVETLTQFPDQLSQSRKSAGS
jgi:hypothetical protein